MSGYPSSMDPKPSYPYEELDDTPNKSFVLRPVFSGAKFGEVIAYPVIVEMWEKRRSGRVKRAYLREFSEEERKLLSRYHTKFYRWHLISGAPQKVSLELKTLNLLQRATNFFASI